MPSTTDRYHGIYYLNGINAVTYFEDIMTSDEKNDWKRSWFINNPANDPKTAYIYRENQPANGSIIITNETRSMISTTVKFQITEKGTIDQNS